MFEWCEGSDRLQGVLETALSLAGVSSAGENGVGIAPSLLVVGCGTSALSADLWADGRRRVHSVDVDADAIQVLDLIEVGRPLDDIGAAPRSKLEHEAYNLAVDKGTFDYFLCGEAGPAADALAAVHSALAPEGVLLVVSIHPLKLMRSLFAQPALLGFREVESWSLPADDTTTPALSAPQAATGAAADNAKPTAALALRRVSRALWTMELREEAARHIVQVLDAHFSADVPLLTAEREAELQNTFRRRPEAALDDGAGRLPLEEAHRAMFPSPAEQAEYTLELFLEDLRADPQYSKATSLCVDEALDFLRRNQ